MPNPCQGIKGYRENGRDIYVDDELMAKIMLHAGRPLQFALRLAHLTAQRPGDILRMKASDISNGILRVQQGKTKAKLRIVIEGELAVLLNEIAAYKAGQPQLPSNLQELSLLISEEGKPLTAGMLRKRFNAAREAAGIDKSLFQFRDLRAKAATETDEVAGTRNAQALLGHTTESMTANYIRHKVGKKVKLLK